MKAVVFFTWLFLIGALTISKVFAVESIPPELADVGIDERLGSPISLDSEFKDEHGENVALRKFFDGKHPVILTLVYYECPNLCNFLLNGFTASLKSLAWTPGEPFKIVTLSIDPRETPELATKKKQAYLELYGRSLGPEGWNFLTGSEEKIRKLAREVGFKYKYDEEQKQYAHTAALFVLTPDGKLSRVLYGIEFNPRDLRLALVEAGQGKIGTWVDQFLLFCYHYDPQGKKYALMALNLMKLAGAATVAGIGLLIWRLSRTKRPTPARAL